MTYETYDVVRNALRIHNSTWKWMITLDSIKDISWMENIQVLVEANIQAIFTDDMIVLFELEWLRKLYDMNKAETIKTYVANRPVLDL